MDQIQTLHPAIERAWLRRPGGSRATAGVESIARGLRAFGAKSALTHREIRDQLGISQQSANSVVFCLREAELIRESKKVVLSINGRATRAQTFVLTPKGRKTLAEITPADQAPACANA